MKVVKSEKLFSMFAKKAILALKEDSQSHHKNQTLSLKGTLDLVEQQTLRV